MRTFKRVVGLLVLAGLIVFVGSAFLPTWVSTLSVVVILALVVLLVWQAVNGGSARAAVARFSDSEATPDEQQIVKNVRRNWASYTDAAGLSSFILDKKGEKVPVFPAVVGWKRSPGGLDMSVEMIFGQPVDSFMSKIPALASAVNFDLRAEVQGPRNVRVTWPLRDSLAGVRYSDAAPYDPDFVGPVTVGRMESGADAEVDFSDAAHTAIQGMTRSGKSAFCYTLLSQFAHKEAVHIGGVDPNHVLLSPWADAEGGSSKWLALGSDTKKVAEVLTNYVQALDGRLDHIVRSGIEKIEHFDQAIPLMVCVLEEYPAILANAKMYDSDKKAGEKLLPVIQQAVGRLLFEGAKAGMRVLLIAQRMDASIVGGAERSQFGTRITFAVDNGDGVRMLHPEATPETIAAVTQFPPGRCLFSRHRRESIVQADLTEYQDYRARVGAREVR